MKPQFKAVIASAILLSGIDYAAGEELIATRNIRAGATISAADIETPKSALAMRMAARVIGMQATRNLYKGKPFAEMDLETPRLVERNAIVAMEYVKGPLSIESEGRALDEGGEGERIRVLNLHSKRVVTATILGADKVRVN